MTTTFNVGDIVCHACVFLRNVGWYTDVPLNGKVLEIQSCDRVLVQWCDQEEPTPIHIGNIILFSERHLEPA